MKPVIAEILRTGVRHVPLLLCVDRVVVQAVQAVADEPRKGKRRTNSIQRIYLTDNELVIQALLLPELKVEVEEGDQLKIHKYTVRKAARKDHFGQVVFLGIEDCDHVTRSADSAETVEEEGGGFIREEPTESRFLTSRASSKRSAYEISEDLDPTLPPPSKQARLDQESGTGSEIEMSSPSATQDSDDDFESVTPNPNLTQHRRQALRELDLNRSPFLNTSTSDSLHKYKPIPQSAAPELVTPKPIPTKLTAPFPHPPSPPASTPISTPSLLPLAALPSLPPSSPTTILALITWVSPTILRPSPAFPPKRHIKIHDLSIGHLFSGVSLAVYIDAASFRPERGTIALFRDVVVQRCGGGGGVGAEVNECFMLNAYANLPGKLAEKEKENQGECVESSGGAKWFVDDEDELLALGLGGEVDQLRKWWDEREARRANVAARSTQQVGRR